MQPDGVNIKGRKHCIWEGQHRGLKLAINKMENAQTIPQPPGKQGIVRKASFTQENFSQDRREGGSEGERENDLLAIAKAEDTRVKDGNSWFWDAKKPQVWHISRACTGHWTRWCQWSEDTSNLGLVHFLSRDCRQKDHWLPLKVNAGSKQYCQWSEPREKCPIIQYLFFWSIFFLSDYERNIYSLHKISNTEKYWRIK